MELIYLASRSCRRWRQVWLTVRTRKRLFNHFTILVIFVTLVLGALFNNPYPQFRQLWGSGLVSALEFRPAWRSVIGAWLSPCCSNSLLKKLYSILSLLTHAYKWIPAIKRVGVTLRWTSIPSRRACAGRGSRVAGRGSRVAGRGYVARVVGKCAGNLPATRDPHRTDNIGGSSNIPSRFMLHKPELSASTDGPLHTPTSFFFRCCLTCAGKKTVPYGIVNGNKWYGRQ